MASARRILTGPGHPLPSLVANVSPRPTAVPNCDTLKANGNCVRDVGYALAELGALPNAYPYVDADHHGWIGWGDDFNASAKQIAEAAKAEGSTLASVRGVIANAADYGAITEPWPASSASPANSAPRGARRCRPRLARSGTPVGVLRSAPRQEARHRRRRPDHGRHRPADDPKETAWSRCRRTSPAASGASRKAPAPT
ncbi:glycoside hydrolase family 6 protein, partial [Streptomyces sp. ZG43]